LRRFDVRGLDVRGFDPRGFGVRGLGVRGLGVRGLGVRGLGVRGLGVRGLGVRGLGVRGLGVRGLGVRGFGVRGFGVRGFDVRGLDVRGLDARGRWLGRWRGRWRGRRGNDTPFAQLGEERIRGDAQRHRIGSVRVADDQNVDLAALAALLERGDHGIVDVPAVASLLGGVFVANAVMRVEPIDLEAHPILIEQAILLDREASGFEPLLEQGTGGAFFHAGIVTRRPAG
jgi:hypothetical protein